MRFLMFIKHAETSTPVQPPKGLMDAMGGFVAEGFEMGWLKETAGLKGSSESRRIRSKGGKLTVTDGPFAETKEVVGGYAIVETKTKDEALEVARRFMELHQIHWPEFECESEIRQIEAMS